MQLLNYRCTSTCPKRQRAWKYSQHQELICGSRIQFCSWKSHKGDLDSQRCCQRVLSLGEFGVDKASLLAGGFQNALSFFFFHIFESYQVCRRCVAGLFHVASYWHNYGIPARSTHQAKWSSQGHLQFNHGDLIGNRKGYHQYNSIHIYQYN